MRPLTFGETHHARVSLRVRSRDIAYEKVVLPIFVDLVQGVSGIGEFRFGEEDIVRSKILKEIVRRYEQWKYKLVGGTGNGKPK